MIVHQYALSFESFASLWAWSHSCRLGRLWHALSVFCRYVSSYTARLNHISRLWLWGKLHFVCDAVRHHCCRLISVLAFTSQLPWAAISGDTSKTSGDGVRSAECSAPEASTPWGWCRDCPRLSLLKNKTSVGQIKPTSMWINGWPYRVVAIVNYCEWCCR